MPECTSTGCRRERFAFVAFFRHRETIHWVSALFGQSASG